MSNDQEKSKANDAADVFCAMVMAIPATFAIIATVFLRRDFGERYLRPLSAFTMATLLGLLTFFLYRHRGFPLAGPIPPFCLTVAFIIFAIFHLCAIDSRNKRGERCYSFYAGKPAGFWRKLPFLSNISDSNIFRFLEPLLVLGLGILLLPISIPLCFVFIISSCSMYVYAQLNYWRFQHRILDAIDAEIESEAFAIAVREAKSPVKSVSGFAMPYVHPNRVPRGWGGADASAQGPMLIKDPPAPTEPLPTPPQGE